MPIYLKKPFTIHNTVWAIIALLRSLKVKVNNSTLKGILESHPDFPSLSAIKYNQTYKFLLGNLIRNFID
ncbi:hypothetical protein GCM10008119_02960 [Pedobacter mendelii]|uniref:Uncharacterized protein n=1 Tax=Pedobacter mendelii TaxID=1908240 RepID=A0ABQ2BC45_9SPHI|nr:hypothetical protein GCM10008119_02960 [Pedobacter mendelii]